MRLGCKSPWMLKPQLATKNHAIFESRDLSTMDMETLFGKLKEHEMEQKRITNDEE